MKSARKGKGTRSLWNLCFGFLLVSLNASCQKEQRDSGALRTEFDTVNGVSFSVNYGEPPLWALDTVLTLGGLFATEEAQRFGRVGAVVADAQGNIFVGDVIRNEILVFTPTGEHLRTIGREGAGPGEFRSPRSLGVLGDTLAVSDPINLRLGLFDLYGTWVGQWPIRPNLGGIAQTGPQEFWLRTLRVIGSEYEEVFVRYSSSGPSDTVPARPDSNRDLMEPRNSFDCEFPDGWIRGFSVPFSPQIVRIPGPNGEILESDPVGYRMVFTSTLGDTLRVVEYRSSDIPVTDDDWEGQLDRWRAFNDEYPGGSCGPIIRPERKRLIHNVFYDDLGRLWVERVQVESSSKERFDIFEYDGKLVGKVITPERTWEAGPFIRGDKVYLVTLDSLDVPFVHVLRFKESPSH